MTDKIKFELEVYEVIVGTDNWPLVETIEGTSEEDCLNKASSKYDQENYHWTNPYKA